MVKKLALITTFAITTMAASADASYTTSRDTIHNFQRIVTAGGQGGGGALGWSATSSTDAIVRTLKERVVALNTSFKHGINTTTYVV